MFRSWTLLSSSNASKKNCIDLVMFQICFFHVLNFIDNDMVFVDQHQHHHQMWCQNLNQVVHGWKCHAYPHFAFHCVMIKVPNPYSNKALQDVSYHGFLQCQWYSLCQILLPSKFVFIGHNPNILKLVEWNFVWLEDTCIKKLEFMKGVGQ